MSVRIQIQTYAKRFVLIIWEAIAAPALVARMETEEKTAKVASRDIRNFQSLRWSWVSFFLSLNIRIGSAEVLKMSEIRIL